MREMHICTIKLAIFVALCLHSQHAQSIQHSQPGWVVPSSVEQVVGGDFNISCSINKTHLEQKSSESCDVQELYFQARHTEKIFKGEPHIQKINETTILFMAHNAAEQQDEYMCKCRKFAIMPSRVYIGTKPLEVTDFGCIGYDYVYMVCNFTAPSNNLLTSYNVSYTLKNPNYKFFVDCNHDAAPVVTCNITDENYKKYDPIFHFTMDIHNKLGSISQSFQINNHLSQIPARPGHNLTVVNKTSDSICLSWGMERRSNYQKGLLWHVVVKPQNFPELKRPEWPNNTDPLVEKLCLNKLPYAGYSYSLKLRVRSNMTNSTYSDPLKYNFRTAAERPRRPPNVTQGNFYVYSSEEEVRVYWEQLELYEQNGEDFKYIISEFRKNGTIVNPAPIEVESNSVKIMNWTKDAHYDIFIKSSNIVNDSIEASHMIIPPISDLDFRVHKPRNIRSVYHPSTSSFTLSWEKPEDDDGLINYTVFWCNSKPALPTECEGSIHFKNVSSTVREFTREVDQTKTLNMAVSANFERFNTGMHWLICTRDITDDLDKMEPIIDKVTSTSLTVKWSTERVCPVILTGYNLTYCQRSEDKPDNCTTVVIRDRYSKVYEIHNLEPYTYYGVRMLMFSETKASKYSDDRINRTDEAAPTPPRQLEFRNVTNSSVTLSWKPPLRTNGVVRTYNGTFVHNNKTDYFELPASPAELVNNENRVSYVLHNLTAYTNYEIRISARTLFPSKPSDAVHFQTKVGVPSPPHLFDPTTKNELTTLNWAAPIRPAGRIEYYEVAVTETVDERSVIRCVSYVLPRQNRTSFLDTPKCTSRNQFQYQVRAVNVELLDDTADMESEEGENMFAENSCNSHSELSDEETNMIQLYQNEARYRHYKSEWHSYGVSCLQDSSMQKLMLNVIEIIVVITFLIICGHRAYVKLRYMSNIECQLPTGIMESLKKASEGGTMGSMDSGISSCIRDSATSAQYRLPNSQQDFSTHSNESAKLLLSAATTPGRCNESDPAIYAYPELPSYMSMHRDFLENENAVTAEQKSSDYTSVAELNAAAAAGNGNNGYIKPTQMKNWSTPVPSSMQATNANMLPNLNNTTTPAMDMNMETFQQLSASGGMPLSGYVPVQVLQARPAPKPSLQQQQQQAVPSMLNSSNYVQVSDLHKLMPPVSELPAHGGQDKPKPIINDFGYTTMEQLERAGLIKSAATGPTLAQQQMSALDNSRDHLGGAANNGHPQSRLMSGYVTPQELNALAQNHNQRQVL
ncbi:cytokine receptor-like [Scaptodrosophila lebanonensis]|uniref:Cytokine receptor-like n=1 Tax=Drosophila lebanonensis TaxID=7225 RepID=A0A6J2TSZ3_DROLE|nr:cytokine receptor-like [Scaptodrosophila lebanonensis]